mgnify:CR=1 FL=1
MNKFNLSKQLIYKLFLSFALLILSLVSAKANDVYYEQCSSLSDIVDGQTYLLVISDGKKHYAVCSNSPNCYSITMESDNTIKNPVNSIKWTATAGSSKNTFYFQNGTKGLYYKVKDKNTDLSTTTTNKSLWYISKLETKNAFKIAFDAIASKYISWKDANTFVVYGTFFYNQLEGDKGLLRQAGAFYIYKEVSGPTLSATVSSLDFVTTEAKPTDTKSFSLLGTKLISPATLSITGDNADLFSVSTTSIEPTDGSIPSTQITVSYNPASTSTPATHTAILNITSTVAAPIAIALKGSVVSDQTVYHKVSWMVNGSPYSAGTPTTTVADGSKVSQLPTAPANINEYNFVGWTTSQITTNQSTTPSVLFTSASGAPAVTADVVYYAVYASQDGANQWKRLNASEVKEEGVYAIITSRGYAFSGFISSGKSDISSSQFSFNNLGIANDAPKGICELTLKKNGNGFSMYNAQKGYLYAKKNAAGNLDWHPTETGYWYCNNDNWCYNENGAYLQYFSSTKNDYFNTYGDTRYAPVFFAQKISSASYTTTIASAPSYAAKAISLQAEASNAYWATFSYSEPIFFPEAVAVNAITVADGRIIANADVFESSTDVAIGDETLSGVYVPANTGVLIKSSESNITCYVVANKSVSAIAESRNMLKPAPTNGGVFTSAPDKIYYKLAYDDFFTQKDLGFYYGADAGGAFYVKAETAYLAVPTAISEGAKAFVLDDETTAINGISTRNNQAETVYNLNGQRVTSMAKSGLYIVNGKKVVRK